MLKPYIYLRPMPNSCGNVRHWQLLEHVQDRINFLPTFSPYLESLPIADAILPITLSFKSLPTKQGTCFSNLFKERPNFLDDRHVKYVKYPVNLIKNKSEPFWIMFSRCQLSSDETNCQILFTPLLIWCLRRSFSGLGKLIF